MAVSRLASQSWHVTEMEIPQNLLSKDRRPKGRGSLLLTQFRYQRRHFCTFSAYYSIRSCTHYVGKSFDA